MKSNKLFFSKKTLAKPLINDNDDFYHFLSKKLQELSDDVKMFYEKLIPPKEIIYRMFQTFTFKN